MASDLKEDETTLFTHAPFHHISRSMITGKCLNASLYLRGEKKLREDNVTRFCSSSPTWELNSATSEFLPPATSCCLSWTPEDTGWGAHRLKVENVMPQNPVTLCNGQSNDYTDPHGVENNKATIMTVVAYSTSIRSTVFRKIW